MNIITFQLVTPEKIVLTKELTSLTCPTELGQITILPNHAGLVAKLKPGELHAKTKSEDFYIFVSGGFVEVKEGSKVTILADAAEHHFEIDEQRALEAKTRAQEQLAKTSAESSDYAIVAASLERSLSRLNIARKRGSRKGVRNESDFND